MDPFDQFLDRLTRCFTPQLAEQIVQLRLDPELLERISFLAHKANDDKLTEAEDREYKTYIESGDMIARLMSRARRFLLQHGK